MARNKFNEFPQRDIDIDALEKELLSNTFPGERPPRRYENTVKQEGAKYAPAETVNQETFYGMITYVSLSLNEEDNLVSFYDNKEKFDAEIEYQKSKPIRHYTDTHLTKNQFIEKIGTALETSGHYTAIGSALEGDYTQEVANWRANHSVKRSVYPELVELNEKAEIVYNWEQSNKIEEKDCATTTDGHTGQIFIVSDKKFEERYEQIMSIAAKYLSGDENIVIQQYPNGKYYNLYGYDERRDWAFNRAGAFDTFVEAEKMLYAHRPTAEKVIEHTKTNVPQKTKEYLSLPRLEKGEFENLTKQLKDEGAKFDPEKKQWYITPEADKEKIEGLVQSVREVHQEGMEYLSLPRLEKGEFENLTKQLKDEGAKFDPEKKQWYITPDMDQSKFVEFLPKKEAEAIIPGMGDKYNLQAEVGGKLEAEQDRQNNLLSEKGQQEESLTSDEPEGNHESEDLISQCKGYAYAENQEKPTVLHGEDKEEILSKLNAWNRGRSSDNQFQNVSIGVRDETGKYGGYVKYDMSGRDISNTYLTLPSMTKEEFKKVTGELKENGARFNSHVKKWYITPDMDQSKFVEFLPKKETEVTIPDAKDEYSLSIGMTPDDNRCMAYFKEGAAVLEGQDYDVNFPILPIAKIKEIVDGELASGHLNLLTDYTPAQALQAAKSALPAEEFNLINQSFNYPQIQAVWDGFREGYSMEQVAAYANPDMESWQMTMVKNASYYGIQKEDLTSVLEPLQSGSDLKVRYDRLEKLQEEKRIDLAKKINQSGLQSSRNLVNNVFRLNHLTQHPHSVADMATAFKESTYAEDPNAAEVLNKIAKEFSRQEHLREIAT